MRRIADLQSVLTVDPFDAIDALDRIVETENDEEVVREACQVVANYFRHSSVYKRKIMLERLGSCSLMCKLQLSFCFHRFGDSMFPRRLMLQGTSLFDRRLDESPHRRHHLTAVGTNRFFNLGVLSDGSPIEEPRLVSLPRVTRIEMSNSHTIFLTDDNRIFGCGKASSFLPNGVEKTDGGYVALPTEIEIPTAANNNYQYDVRNVRVHEGGTDFLIGDRWFFIGKHKCSGCCKKLSSNCSVAPDGVSCPPPAPQTSHVPFKGSRVQIYVKLDEGMLVWDRNTSLAAKKLIHVIINGIAYNSSFEHFAVLADGSIYASHNGMVKGRLELWKNSEDGFTVKNGTEMEHFDTKYTLVALMEEVPGSIGTEFFAVSPDGQNLIMKMGYRTENDESRPVKFHSLRTHAIIEARELQMDPADVPCDLTIVSHEYEWKRVELITNRVVFEMMFPEFEKRIDNNQFHFPTFDLESYAFNIDLDRPRHLPLPTDPELEFVPKNTDPSMIWHLKTTDQKVVSCHKYPLLLHSRQIGAMQRFNANSYFLAAEPAEKSEEIEAHASRDTVRNALRGMLNPATLFGLKTIELIECINFYDYHLMDELFADAFHVLMETVTDFTLPLLFELFYSFEDHVVDGLVSRPYLLFNSISPVLPPKELVAKFCEQFPRSKLQPCKPSESAPSLNTYDSEDVAKYFLDLDQDSEDCFWLKIENEFGGMLKSEKAEAMRRREEKKRVRRRTNSQTFRPDTSSPIAIRPKSVSFSESIGSPIQSPLSSATKSIPIPKNRTNSISNSLEDFPEMGASPSSSLQTPQKLKSPGGRFAPKGTRFVKDNQILKPVSPANPWKKGGAIQEEESTVQTLNFDDIVQKEEKLQRNIRTGFKKVQLLPHVEIEELAGAEILEVFRREFHDEALVCVELVITDDFEVENEQIVWGNMPGLIRR